MTPTIRFIFAVFALVICGLFVWRLSTGVWTLLNWGMLLVAAICCASAFVRFVYVFNFGYALCVMLNGMLIGFTRPSLATILVAGVAILYGLRLFAFTWMRYRSDSYAAKAANAAREDQNMPVPVKLSIWFMMTSLMTFHLMALWFVAERGVLSPGVAVGALTMLAGVLLEAIADRQKQRSKAQSPDRFVTIGLFKRWRHPNYVGEILFQVGLIVAGVASIATTGNAITAVVAPLYIVILMVAEAHRLDLVQKAHYAEDTAYQDYRQQSGSLFPRL